MVRKRKYINADRYNAIRSIFAGNSACSKIKRIYIAAYSNSRSRSLLAGKRNGICLRWLAPTLEACQRGSIRHSRNQLPRYDRLYLYGRIRGRGRRRVNFKHSMNPYEQARSINKEYNCFLEVFSEGRYPVVSGTLKGMTVAI